MRAARAAEAVAEFELFDTAKHHATSTSHRPSRRLLLVATHRSQSPRLPRGRVISVLPLGFREFYRRGWLFSSSFWPFPSSLFGWGRRSRRRCRSQSVVPGAANRQPWFGGGMEPPRTQTGNQRASCLFHAPPRQVGVLPAVCKSASRQFVRGYRARRKAALINGSRGWSRKMKTPAKPRMN